MGRRLCRAPALVQRLVLQLKVVLLLGCDSSYLLGLHPFKVVEKGEACWVIERSSSQSAALQVSFPFTTAVWKESMRLYPPGALYGRQAEADMVLAGKYFIPKATQVHASMLLQQASDILVPEH